MSDIHIEPKEKILAVRYRIDGILRHKTDLPIALAPGLVSRIKILCDLDIAEKRRHQDGRIEARIMDKEIDLRVSVYASGYGENVVIRILHRQSELIELDALGISPANRARFQQILDQPSGIILVTGPTGSGKTTTVYATLNYLNDGEKSIITVEDPIEYTMEGVVQGQLNPKLGMTYVDFLKAMMRQDPDVIMVGEIRDVTAAEAVVQAALTGHKVLSTFHTDDTTGALLRLMDMGIDTFLISSTVVSILAQRLVRVLCKSCRKNYEPDPRLLSSFGIRTNGPINFEFWQPVGCSSCDDTGFKGRIAVHELLLVNDAIRNAILARLPSGQIRLIARNDAKLISMREDGFYKATKGITSLEEVLRVVFYNESDELSPRSSEEVIALCELVPTLIKEQTDSKPIPKDISAQATGASISIRDSDLVVTDGEVFRIRFDVTTIETETYQIADLFKEYQNAIEKVGKVVDSDLLGDFIDLLIYTVKRLEVSLKAEFVEFSLRVEKDNVKILLETLIPKKPLTSTFHTSRETGLRLINFLMPPSGMDRAIEAESGYMKKRGHGQKTPSLIGFLKQDGATPSEWVGRSEYGEPPSADHKPAEEQEVDGPSYPISSSLYKKLVEELELSSYLKDWEGRK